MFKAGEGGSIDGIDGGGGEEWWHYNGLPPNRRLTKLTLRGKSVSSPAPVAPPKHAQSTFRAEVGELESVVQAHPADKAAFKTAWRRRRFEICVTTEEMVAEDAATRERPKGEEGPAKFELGEWGGAEERWRCVKCYSGRFRTMCFGENPPGNAVCKFCGAEPAGNFTIWRHYDELPEGTKRRIDVTESKILKVLRTRWKGVELAVGLEGKVLGSDEATAEGGEWPAF